MLNPLHLNQIERLDVFMQPFVLFSVMYAG
jgi:hypothetical protein